MTSMLPQKWTKFPSYPGLRAFILWDFSRLVGSAWREFTGLIGVLASAGILMTIEPLVGASYVGLLVPGIVAAFLLHPFLDAGSLLATENIPRQWRTVPMPLPWFALTGILPRFIFNFIGVLIFGYLMALAGFKAGFLLHPLFWVFLLILIPGALGWGFVINSFLLFSENDSKISWGLRRLFEWTGCVFTPAKFLPGILYGFHFLVPHSYLIHLGRAANSGTMSWGYYFVGILVSLVLFFVGAYTFVELLDRSIQRGRLDRFS